MYTSEGEEGHGNDDEVREVARILWYKSADKGEAGRGVSKSQNFPYILYGLLVLIVPFQSRERELSPAPDAEGCEVVPVRTLQEAQGTQEALQPHHRRDVPVLLAAPQRQQGKFATL